MRKRDYLYRIVFDEGRSKGEAVYCCDKPLTSLVRRAAMVEKLRECHHIPATTVIVILSMELLRKGKC